MTFNSPPTVCFHSFFLVSLKQLRAALLLQPCCAFSLLVLLAQRYPENAGTYFSCFFVILVRFFFFF